MPANPTDQDALNPAGGPAPGLKGLSGSLGLQVADTRAGVLKVEPSGTVSIARDGDTTATLTVDAQSTLAGLLRGDLSPIVADLQERVHVDGDRMFTLRVLFGLQAGSPWRATAPRS